MRRTDGFSLLELIVALTTAGVVGTLLLGTLTAQVRLARVTAHRVADADALRTATTILTGEVRRTLPDDVRTLTRDSAAVRAFRGAALICGGSGAAVAVSYRGDRAPDLGKDSALAIAGDTTQVVALRSVAPDPAGTCADPWGGARQLWRVDPPVHAGVLLVFESGIYYLTGRALRYRLGGEGRQPLTADVFLHPATGFVRDDGAALRFEIAAGVPPLTRAFPAYRAAVVP